MSDQAWAGAATKDHAKLAFDADTRKRTKTKISERLSYGASFGLKHLSESNLTLDAPTSDRTRTTKGSLSFAFRLKLSTRVSGFAHLELSQQNKSTGAKDYGATTALKVKEAHLSFALSDRHTLSVGRLRFSEPGKWGLDGAGDGLHMNYKTSRFGWETAVFRDVFGARGSYVFAHAQVFSKTRVAGGYGLFERVGTKERLHVGGYFQTKNTATRDVSLYGAAVFGDGAGGRSSGVAIDATLTHRFSGTRLKPQLSLGLAFGTQGYLQSDLSSNKAREGGQVQFNRFGSVFQPELSNLAVATVAIGLRPSRKFTLDLRAHAYAQLNASDVAPVARVSGQTSGQSSHIGHEVSLVGAWRPKKKLKIEAGAGIFKPGRAYLNRASSKRIYVRLTQYF